MFSCLLISLTEDEFPGLIYFPPLVFHHVFFFFTSLPLVIIFFSYFKVSNFFISVVISLPDVILFYMVVFQVSFVIFLVFYLIFFSLLIFSLLFSQRIKLLVYLLFIVFFILLHYFFLYFYIDLFLEHQPSGFICQSFFCTLYFLILYIFSIYSSFFSQGIKFPTPSFITFPYFLTFFPSSYPSFTGRKFFCIHL